MPNWCTSAYVICGNASETKELYDLMSKLQAMKEPSVENGFGTTWLGCLVEALGGDYNEIYCRGDWNNLEAGDGVLTLSTETAWGPCNEVFDFLCSKYPSLRYYFQSEEPGMGEYLTNDSNGYYFSEKYYVDICTPDEKYLTEYFRDSLSMFKWFEDLLEQPINSEQDIKAITEKWQEVNEDAFCNIYEFKVVA